MDLLNLFDQAIERKASDIHLAADEVPFVRIGGELVRLECPPLNGSSIRELLQPFLSQESLSKVESGQVIEKSIVHGDLTFSGIVFRFGDEGTVGGLCGSRSEAREGWRGE